MSRIDTRSYYDAFAPRYEDRRGGGYHRLVDDLEVELVAPHAAERSVLEIGCGTGLVLSRLDRIAARAVGVDVSPGMLERARARDLEVYEADAAALPFDDDTFDVVTSFKVLPHVERIETSLQEAARVTRPGGRLFLEFYNRRSLRYLIRRLRPPEPVASRLNEDHVYVRFDRREEVEAILPGALDLVAVHGIRVWTVLPWALDVPGLGGVLRRLERGATHGRLGRFGGFIVFECTKRVTRR